MSDDVVGPYAELRAVRGRLSWLESRLAEIAGAVERARAAVAVGPLLGSPVEPAPAAILTDVILSAEEVARITEAHRRLWEAEVWRTPCGVKMPCDANRLAASHERLRVLSDAAGRDAVALRSVLRELPDAVRALARRIHGEKLVVPWEGGSTMDWGVAAGYFVEQAIKRALAARGLTA